MLLLLIIFTLALSGLVYPNNAILDDTVNRGDAVMVSVTIFPSSMRTLSYRIELYADGLLATTVGPANSNEFIDDKGFTVIEVQNFSPELTMYKRLPDSEIKKLIKHISQIKMPEHNYGIPCNGGWYVAVTYNGKTQQDLFNWEREYQKFNKNMSEFIEKLIENSAIEIVPYAYEGNPFERAYYNSLEWIPFPPIDIEYYDNHEWILSIPKE